MFYNMLDEMGYSDLLMKVPYTPPVFTGGAAVQKLLGEALESGNIFIYGDYDVDGLMCAKIMSEGFRMAGAGRVDIYKYRQRMHNLDPVAVSECIQGGYKYFVVCDTGSSDVSLLKKAVNSGIRVLVLDHHNTSYSYSDFEEDGIVVLNTTIENALGGEYELSAGALCYTVMREFLAGREVEGYRQLAVYAVVSLYADCISMRPALNRSIYYEAKGVSREELPRCIALFLNEWSSFNARFIGYWFSPRVNSMFRSENLKVLNDLFFAREDNVITESRCLEKINSIYERDREMVHKAADILSAEAVVLDNFVIADLYAVDEYISVEANKLYNYTGLVANMLSSNFGKTAVTYCLYDNVYKGSVRDLYGRNYLPVFQRLCYAGGHNAAFGIKVRLFDFDEFMYDLDRVDKQFSISGIGNTPVIIDYKYNEPDIAMIDDIATYNEFAGQDLPIVLLRKQMIGDVRERFNKYNYQYSWGDCTIQSDHAVGFGSTVLIKPIHAGRLKLLVQ